MRSARDRARALRPRRRALAAGDPLGRRRRRRPGTPRRRLLDSRRDAAVLAGRQALGVGDDLAFRRAALRFRLAYTRDIQLARTPDAGQARIRAETALAREIRGDPDRRRASAASNLLGILALVDAATAPAGNVPIDRSVFEFQDAVRLDPANEQAKTNLELLYQQSTYKSSVRGRERLQRSAHAGASSSAGGHGY